MSSATTLADLKCFVAEIMKERAITKYEIHIEGHSGRGENYLGEVTFFSVTTSNNGRRYDMVMKTAKRSEELRKTMAVESAYRRESLMYSKVIPEIERFLEDANCGVKVVKIDFVPKIFWICDEENRETLIMENLKARGFRHWNRRRPMDMNHALFILKHLGEYHATTMAMKVLKPKTFDKFARTMNGIWQEFMEKIDGNTLFVSNLRNAVRCLEEKGNKELADKFKAVEDKVGDIIYGEIPVEDRLVITHGDCWINNILLGYEDENSSTPSKICFVDFQLSSYDTPIKDLSYFIYTACDKTLLDDFDLLLRNYHTSLSENLEALGCNVDDILPYPQLMEHWKRYANFGLILSTMVVKVELLDSDEAPDITEISETGADFAETFNRKIKNEEGYERRMLDVLTHFGRKFL
ncbi:uncharacterized protein LOC123316125 [Coccinella septempunctata]|uniref:uncharacterized protein LOC123316125 n=1 Tax=Coccinella septempunctata TaxID=41139 RepID=UPI001D070A86|nr:uncharacterized protein LOC123316125 [Coccinella septempunctata]